MRKNEKVKRQPPPLFYFHAVKISAVRHKDMTVLRIEGARKLLLCLAHEVKIVLDEEILTVKGAALACTTYASGAIELEGHVEHMSFEGRRQG